MMTGLIAIMLQSMAGAVAPPPPTVPPAPPVVFQPSSRLAIVDYRPGDVRCDGEIVTPVLTNPPAPGGTYTDLPAPIGLAFAIDASGRPISIHPVAEESIHDLRSGPADDVVPALVSWRFPAKAPHAHCSISFAADAQIMEEASEPVLYRFIATRGAQLFHNSSLGSGPAWERVQKGSSCEKAGTALLWANPPFASIAQRRGTYSTVLLRYDVGANGRTEHVRLLSATGNEALGEEALKAVKRTRYPKNSPAAGCVYSFYRFQPDPLQAPPEPPSREPYRRDSDTCPRERGWNDVGESEWEQLPPLRFPGNFNRRDIEGWAIIRYDTAPWGGVGNVSVADAQPAAAFGEAAKRIVAQGTVPKSRFGYTGCLTMVRFLLRPGGFAEPDYGY